jgi:hypothetical protein
VGIPQIGNPVDYSVGIEVGLEDDVWWGHEEYDTTDRVTVLTFRGPVHGRRDSLFSLIPGQYRPESAVFLGLLHRAWSFYYRVWDVEEAAAARETLASDVERFHDIYLSAVPAHMTPEYEQRNRLRIEMAYFLGAPRAKRQRVEKGDGEYFRCFQHVHDHRLQALSGTTRDKWGRTCLTSQVAPEPLFFRDVQSGSTADLSPADPSMRTVFQRRRVADCLLPPGRHMTAAKLEAPKPIAEAVESLNGPSHELVGPKFSNRPFQLPIFARQLLFPPIS